MSRFQFFTRLNSAERRFVIAVGCLVFLGANYMYVWPHFSDWSQFRGRLGTANREYDRRQGVIQESGRLTDTITHLLREGGGGVLPEDQSITFFRTIQAQAGQSGVNLVSNSRLITSTNDPFFVEQVQNIVVASGEKQLVDFLYNLGLGNSQIRVRGLSVRPDTPRQQLNANVTLVASYRKDQKRAQPVAPAVRPAAPAAKPAAKPAGPPAAPVTRPTPPATSPAKPGASNATPNKK